MHIAAAPESTLAGLAVIAYYYAAALKSGLARTVQSPATSFTQILTTDRNEQYQGSESGLSKPRFLSSLGFFLFF